uniref:MADF domain-containing protein n=1 Tax=Biomphalaria glabrata TaxID=6526 RepID=A0A2C9LGF4_BIOGL
MKSTKRNNGSAGRCKFPLSREENEKLIELVRQNRALYDPSYQDHKDVNHLHNIWLTVAMDMGKPAMDGMEWKKKWRNLRDTYVKKIRGIRQNVNVAAMKNWRFFEHMSFLEPFLEDNICSKASPHGDIVSSLLACSRESQEDSYDEPEVSFPCQDSPPSLRDETSSHALVSEDTISDTASIKEEEDASPPEGPTELSLKLPLATETKLRAKKRPRLETFDSNEDQWRGNERAPYISEPSVSECYSARSATQIFFDSCALRLEKLPARTQSFLQFQIAQLFFNAENPDLNPVPIMPLPEHTQLCESRRTSDSLNRPASNTRSQV